MQTAYNHAVPTDVPAAEVEEDGAPRSEFERLRVHMNGRVLGQPVLIDRLLVALLADGHLLVEGAPGLAKTTAIKALAEAVEGTNQRIQFTPDLLPADVTGTDVYRPESATFDFVPGPIMHNVVLADEINRAPAKVQSALLEAMAERHVTVGCTTHQLPDLFLVMATQNPVEQQGTYPLPEAQLDRFLMYVCIGYPDQASEREVLRLVRERAVNPLGGTFAPLSQETVFAARSQVLDVHLSPALEEYMLQLVLATREPAAYGTELEGLVQWGASPRATIGLDRCSRAMAWLDGRDFVTPEDVVQLAGDILRHRIVLTYEAEAEGISADDFVGAILSRVPLP